MIARLGLLAWLAVVSVGPASVGALEPAQPAGFLHNGVTAHRGNSGEMPENTLAAFRSAMQVGADWIELDVYRSRDGKLVVSHDKKTGRVGDKDLAVADATYTELLTVDVATLFRKQRGLSVKECRPERIPLLADVLKLVMTQRKTRLSIQPKMDCVPEIVALLDKLGARPWVGFNDGRLAYMSQVKRLAPELPVFWDRFRTDVDREISTALTERFDAMVLHHSTVTEERIAGIKQAGMAAGAWTVNNRETMRRLLNLGVERIYTDFPTTLLKLKANGPWEGRPCETAWRQTGTLSAPEAYQAAAADERFVYAIASEQIAKYDRTSGRRVAVSTGEAKHLNSGFFWRGRLYCAHSNFPHTPERSEILVLDPATMRLTRFKDFGNFGGSLTWAVRQGQHWWCNFARYGADNAQTFLVKFDDQWRELGRWTYAPELIAQLGRGSLSGGLWRDGALLATDHDHRVLYRLRLPRDGSRIELIGRQEAPFTGQGIAADPSTGGLVGIDRAKRQVLFAKGRKTIRLLTVGNSFSRNATHWLGDLVKAAGHELIHHDAWFGGASMAQHWDRAVRFEKDPNDKKATYGTGRSLKQELLAEKWDFVTIQQYSVISHDPATYWPYARRLRDYAAKYASQAEVLVHQTWAYRCDDPRFTKPPTKPGVPTSQKAMYAALTKAYDGIADELGLRVIPVGDALFSADTNPTWGYVADRKFDPSKVKYPSLPEQRHSLHVGWRWTKDRSGKPLLRMDGHHANVAGEYLGACVFFEMLFNESVVDIAWAPPNLDAAYARFLRETAHRAVQGRGPATN